MIRFSIAAGFAKATGLLLVVFALLVGTTNRASAQVERRAVPRDDYFAAFPAFYDGEYKTAMRVYRSAARGGIRSTEGRWVDSICYHTMIGDCFYHVGRFDQALEQYEAALRLVIVHKNWMKRVEFTNQMQPSGNRVRSTINWGQSPRQAMAVRLPDTMLSLQGNSNAANLKAMQQGGVIAPREFHPLRVTEIVRCTALALRRYREIMGPACKHSPLTNKLVAAFSSRPISATSWAGPWVDIQLGLAKACQGKNKEAITILQRSLLLRGQYDHPLTATALVEIGKLAIEENQLTLAKTSLFSATYPAAEYGQADLMEEAFRLAATIHVLTAQTPFLPLQPAAEWARQKRYGRLRASLLINSAEMAIRINEFKQANVLLTEARRTMRRSELSLGDLGARHAFQLASANFQAGKNKTANSALATALTLQRKNSLGLYQIQLVDKLFKGNVLSERIVSAVYKKVLREPTAVDWQFRPLDTLALVSTPHPDSFATWFKVAMQRGNTDLAIQVADQLRRHRFFVNLPMGGRQLALRWIAEAPKELLPESVLVHRQDLMTKYPELQKLSKAMAAAQQQLASLPVATEDRQQLEKQKKLVAEVAKHAQQEEQLLQWIALQREPSEFVMPPLRTSEQIRNGLRPGQAAIVFVTGRKEIHGFLLTREKYANWKAAASPKFTRQLAGVLQGIGLVEKSRPVNASDLNDEWKPAAQSLLTTLIGSRGAEFWSSINELIIVPDGQLWNVPFEMLPVSIGNETRPLASVAKVRYAPTASLASNDPRPPVAEGKTAIVVGKLFGRDEEHAEAMVEELKLIDAEAAVLAQPLPGATSVLSTQWNRLVVLDDIEAVKKPLELPVAQIDRGKAGSNLHEWMALLFGTAQQIILPGFRTPAATGLKGSRSGETDMFLTTCGLLSAGCRTALISRWPTAGQTSVNLIREFVQELPFNSAANAWQRSVDLTATAEVDPDAEPRLNASTTDAAVTGEHPLFWAGFMLLDTGSAPAEPEAAPLADK